MRSNDLAHRSENLVVIRLGFSKPMIDPSLHSVDGLSHFGGPFIHNCSKLFMLNFLLEEVAIDEVTGRQSDFCHEPQRNVYIHMDRDRDRFTESR